MARGKGVVEGLLTAIVDKRTCRWDFDPPLDSCCSSSARSRRTGSVSPPAQGEGASVRPSVRRRGVCALARARKFLPRRWCASRSACVIDCCLDHRCIMHMCAGDSCACATSPDPRVPGGFGRPFANAGGAPFPTPTPTLAPPAGAWPPWQPVAPMLSFTPAYIPMHPPTGAPHLFARARIDF